MAIVYTNVINVYMAFIFTLYLFNLNLQGGKIAVFSEESTPEFLPGQKLAFRWAGAEVLVVLNFNVTVIQFAPLGSLFPED